MAAAQGLALVWHTSVSARRQVPRLVPAHSNVELGAVKYRAQYPCRCSNWTCRKRKTLPRRPCDYIRQQPACWNCGRRQWTIDRHRRLREHQKYACDCRGIWGLYDFKGAPHRRGSRWCVHSTNPPTDAEVMEQMGYGT